MAQLTRPPQEVALVDELVSDSEDEVEDPEDELLAAGSHDSAQKGQRAKNSNVCHCPCMAKVYSGATSGKQHTPSNAVSESCQARSTSLTVMS